MSDFVIAGLSLAVLLFWALGAYNRLKRLRAQGLHAFSVLAGLLNQTLALVKAPLVEQGASLTSVDTQSGIDTRAGWRICCEQFSAALLDAQAQPLNAAALGGLSLAWARLRVLSSDPLGITLPSALSRQWVQVSAQTDLACAEFNQRVINYNEAIHQFPADMLACVLGFKSAQPIEV